MNQDPRIPVVVGRVEDRQPGDHVLEPPMPEPAALHPAGCLCCAPRDKLARRLSGLHLAAMRGEVAPFRRVLLLGGADAAEAAIAGDVVARARFRFAGRA